MVCDPSGWTHAAGLSWGGSCGARVVGATAVSPPCPAVAAEMARCRSATEHPRPVSSLHWASHSLQDVRFDGVGGRSILSNFPCPTVQPEDPCPCLARRRVSCCLRVLLLCSPLPISLPDAKRNTSPYPYNPPGWFHVLRFWFMGLPSSAPARCAPFSSHLPIIAHRLDHVSPLRFRSVLSWRSGLTDPQFPNPFCPPFTDNSRRKRQALWTGMICTNQLMFLVA